MAHVICGMVVSTTDSVLVQTAVAESPDTDVAVQDTMRLLLIRVGQRNRAVGGDSVAHGVDVGRRAQHGGSLARAGVNSRGREGAGCRTALHGRLKEVAQVTTGGSDWIFTVSLQVAVLPEVSVAVQTTTRPLSS